MQYFLDVRATQNPANAERGIGRYVNEHVAALLAERAEVKALAFDPLQPMPESLHPAFAESGLVTVNSLDAFRRVARDGPVVYYSMSLFEPDTPPDSLLPPYAFDEAAQAAVTVYDLIPYDFETVYQGDEWGRRRYRARLANLRRFDTYLCISEHTRHALIDRLSLDPAQTHTIGAGVSAYFSPASDPAEPSRVLGAQVPEITRPFVFTVVGQEWRKNTERLIEAFAALPADVRSGLQLVATCSLHDETRRVWMRLARDAGLADDALVLTGHVDDRVLRALYQAAELFVFPSLAEGFGLPPAEAARCGTPSMTSNTTSLPEVLGLPDATFDPYDVDDMADAMLAGLTDDALRADMRAAGQQAAERHTWAEVARRTIEALAPDPAAPGRRRRVVAGGALPRVALVGPFAPSRSGVAAYNLRMAEHLAARVRLDCFVEDRGDGPRRRVEGAKTMSVDALGTVVDPTNYDALVYSIGNSGYHIKTLERAWEFPGVVWLHDTNLAGLFYSRVFEIETTDDAREDRLAEHLVEAYGAVPDGLRDRLLDLDAYAEADAPLAALACRGAIQVLVHSHDARDQVEADLARAGLAAPVSVLPLAVPDIDAPPSASREPLVVSLGHLAWVKRPLDLVEAFAAAGRTGARLAFIGGEADDGVSDAIAARAQKLGIADRVVVAGHVPQDDYATWLGRATVAVQLRQRSHGESSAAVNDAIAAGLPVISSVASARELPAGLADAVPTDISVSELSSMIARAIDNPPPPAFLAAAREDLRFPVVARRVAELVAT